VRSILTASEKEVSSAKAKEIDFDQGLIVNADRSADAVRFGDWDLSACAAPDSVPTENNDLAYWFEVFFTLCLELIGENYFPCYRSYRL
jgi:hypothetical protein